MTKLTWPAPERNKQPILDVLERVLPVKGSLLELASGTGQHAAHFAQRMPGWTFQPTDVDPANIASIREWARDVALPNLREPLHLNVCDEVWEVEPVDAIFNANLIHIAPWEVTLGLLSGAGRYLLQNGTLALYGPFRISNRHTAPSNEAFDQDLRRRDPRFGVRDLEAVVGLAREYGLTLRDCFEMPANNQLLVFDRRAA